VTYNPRLVIWLSVAQLISWGSMSRPHEAASEFFWQM